MLKNLTFKYKMMIMPLLAIGALCLLLFVTQYFSKKHLSLLTQIESGTIPVLEWSYNLDSQLNMIQRGMQDAVTMADPDKLITLDTLSSDRQ